MSEISKADWKLFMERVPQWQERYMQRLIREYVKLLTSSGEASDLFWKLEKKINKDKKNPGVMIELSKSEAIWDIAIMIKKKVITIDDLDGFSQDLIDSVKMIL